MAQGASRTRVGQYVLLREIGRGAMATVHEAEHAQLGKRVALKWMHPHLAADATASSRFLREGKVAAQIRHPNVVDVFDVGAEGGVPFLVMELLDGVDLAAHLREKGKLSLREVADLMLPIVAAVQVAHDVGVVHRDLKPSNVVLARRDKGVLSPTVLDFGISKMAADHERDLTSSEVLLGTVHYMSPEQTRGARNASARSDQYALGVMLYECATGAKPFAGTTPYGLMHAIVSAPVTPPSTLEPSLPAGFDALVARAMHRDPARRFESARALGAALTPWATDPARWVDVFGAPPASGGRRGPRAWASAALLLVVAGVGAFAWVRALAPRPRESPAVAAAPTPSASLPPAATPSAPSTTALPEPTPPVDSAPAPSASSRARPPSTAAAPRPAPSSAPSAPPERGTNGALIVE